MLEEVPTTPNLAVSVSALFPQAEVFGIKLVNGHATQALLSFENKEPKPVTVAVVGSALSTLQELPAGSPEYAGVVRNLTQTRYGLEIPSGQKASLPYTFATDMNPQDLRLRIVAVLQGADGNVYQIQAFNETVSIVEPATSLLDPQMQGIPQFNVISKLTRTLVSSSTSSLRLHSPVPYSSFTRAGSRLCSPRHARLARAESGPESQQAVQRRPSTRRIRSL